MLQEFLSQLCEELEILPIPTVNERHRATFRLREDAAVELCDLRPGVSFFSTICPCPSRSKEELFMQLMSANYLGQLTGASRIGMSADEKFLTLSFGMPYELGYRQFRESMEDFLNFLFHWREEIVKFEQQKALS